MRDTEKRVITWMAEMTLAAGKVPDMNTCTVIPRAARYDELFCPNTTNEERVSGAFLYLIGEEIPGSFERTRVPLDFHNGQAPAGRLKPLGA